jgi:glycosyltransferase involved in cell wall biosynthesis
MPTLLAAQAWSFDTDRSNCHERENDLMRIVIDMQGAQSTGSRNRGIGRYTRALSREMARLRGGHEVILVLNGLFPETIEPLRAAFSGLLPEENIRVWEAAGPVHAFDPSNDARRKAAELTREAFIASLRPDIVLISSLFEGGVDNAVTSIGEFAHSVPTALILYDLIPLIHRASYLQNPQIERWYMNKLGHLRRADLLLAISASSGKEAIQHIGFSSDQVVSISTACDTHFRPMAVDEARWARLRETYGLVRPFVMYTGGIDHRKNIEGLIRAYGRLPGQIREAHQLAVVCSIQPTDRERLQKLAREEGLGEHEVVFTGYVPEADLLLLYNACRLFVFPSWHEGFGLPALEAMACGRAVIGANTSSLPEVIEREDALFDPLDNEAMARTIEAVLTQEDFRTELERHGQVQAKKFSWEKSARRAWEALEAVVSERKQAPWVPDLTRTPRRPRLAYVSPLPPEHSGISDYSAELLPELARHYQIEVIVAQEEVSDAWVRANCPIRDVTWFRSHAHRFHRVMYHFGNSPFHSHMFGLLAEFPGVVLLHDSYLSAIVAHMDAQGFRPNGWAQALIHAHGWPALQSRYRADDAADTAWQYPCNLEVLQQALGVVVHSEHSRELARQWYGAGAADDWAVIPLLRAPATKTDRREARQTLGLPEADFVACAFGILGPTKLNHRLLDAWLASPLPEDPGCRLVFVGENHGGDYGADLVRRIHERAPAGRIEITGWVDAETYRTWLAAADVGVQLRSLSRGETSGAVLDCMNHGLATIVNAHGSAANLPTDAVWMLSDAFRDEDLIGALTTLRHDDEHRRCLGERAREVIHIDHAPRRCAERYMEAVERCYWEAFKGPRGLVTALASVEPPVQAEDRPRMAAALTNNFPPRPRRKQLLLDVSTLVQCDAKTGVQRVVRALLTELLLHPPEGWAVEPVYTTCEAPGYRYARRFTSRFLGVTESWAKDDGVVAWPGDIFLGLDLQHHVALSKKEDLLSWQRRGIKVFFVVYDLLPVLLPQLFPDGMEALHRGWLEALGSFDGAVCISRAVLDEYRDWLKIFGPKRERPLALGWFHLGADVENSVPTTGMPPDAGEVLAALTTRPSFLMVGTIEPRKGHAQTLAAFELLWRVDNDINLVIVGKQGWMMEALAERLRGHPELDKRLFWLEGISDEYLENVYAASTCLIMASEGEGFGLPLIEAARHRRPIIARDLPVFREVAGEHAFYFARDNAPGVLAEGLRDWLALYRAGVHPRSDAMPRQTWKESAQQLLRAILGDTWHTRWMPDLIAASGIPTRTSTQLAERAGPSMPQRRAGFALWHGDAGQQFAMGRTRLE